MTTTMLPALSPLVSSLRELSGVFECMHVEVTLTESLEILERLEQSRETNKNANVDMIRACGAKLWNAVSGQQSGDPAAAKLMGISLKLLCFRLSFADAAAIDESKLIEIAECSGRLARLIPCDSNETESFGFRACEALRATSAVGSFASCRMFADVSTARWNLMEDAVAAGDESKVTWCLEECLEHIHTAVSYGIEQASLTDRSVLLKQLATQSKERAIVMLQRSNYRAAGSFMRENLRLNEVLEDNSAAKSAALVFLSRIHVASGDWNQAEDLIEEANRIAASDEGLFTALQIQVNLSQSEGDSQLSKVRDSFKALCASATLEIMLAAVDLVAQFQPNLAQQLFTSLMQEGQFQTKGMNQIRLRFLRFCLAQKEGNPSSTENAVRLCQAMLEDHRSGHVFLSAEQARTAFSCIFFTSHEAMRNKDYSEALSWLTRALTMLGDHANSEDRAKILRSTALCHLQRGDLQHAAEAVKQSLERELSAFGLYLSSQISLKLLQAPDTTHNDCNALQGELSSTLHRLVDLDAQAGGLPVLTNVAEALTRQYLGDSSGQLLQNATEANMLLLTFALPTEALRTKNSHEAFRCKALRNLLKLAVASRDFLQLSLLKKASALWKQCKADFWGHSHEEFDLTLRQIEAFAHEVASDVVVEPSLTSRAKLCQVAHQAYLLAHDASTQGRSFSPKYVIKAVATVLHTPTARSEVFPCLAMCKNARQRIISSSRVGQTQLEQLRLLFLLEARASVICCVNPKEMLQEITNSPDNLITSKFLEECHDVMKQADNNNQKFKLDCLNQSLSLALLSKPPNYETVARLIRKQFDGAPDAAIDTFQRIFDKLPPENSYLYPECEREHLCFKALSKARLFVQIQDAANLSKWFNITLALLKYTPNYTIHTSAIQSEFKAAHSPQTCP